MTNLPFLRHPWLRTISRLKEADRSPKAKLIVTVPPGSADDAPRYPQSRNKLSELDVHVDDQVCPASTSDASGIRLAFHLLGWIVIRDQLQHARSAECALLVVLGTPGYLVSSCFSALHHDYVACDVLPAIHSLKRLVLGVLYTKYATAPLAVYVPALRVG